jgi:ABC-type spermidine/putrescine transport system permease subunit II
MATTAPLEQPQLRIRGRWLGNALAHGYIWVWLGLFALPFVTTTLHSLEAPDGGYTLDAYDYVFGTFKSNLVTSFKVTILTILINLLISVPAAYGIVRHSIPGSSCSRHSTSRSTRPAP